jgi:hypothetical protein
VAVAVAQTLVKILEHLVALVVVQQFGLQLVQQVRLVKEMLVVTTAVNIKTLHQVVVVVQVLWVKMVAQEVLLVMVVLV